MPDLLLAVVAFNVVLGLAMCYWLFRPSKKTLLFVDPSVWNINDLASGSRVIRKRRAAWGRDIVGFNVVELDTFKFVPEKDGPSLVDMWNMVNVEERQRICEEVEGKREHQGD